MTKFKNLSFMLLAGFLAFTSCDKNSTIDIPLSSVTITMDNIMVNYASNLKSTMNYFEMTQTITYSEIDGLSEEAKKYRKNIESFLADTVYITISSTDGEGTVIENFRIQVDDMSDFSIPEYVFDTPHTADNLQEYVGQLLMKIMGSESGVDINLSGETDVVSGEILSIEITLVGVTLKAKVATLF